MVWEAARSPFTEWCRICSNKLLNHHTNTTDSGALQTKAHSAHQPILASISFNLFHLDGLRNDGPLNHVPELKHFGGFDSPGLAACLTL